MATTGVSLYLVPPHQPHPDPREKPYPPAWRGPLESWLSYLTAGGATPQSIQTRRDHGRRFARALGGAPDAVTDEALVAWMAAQRWSVETRRSVSASARSLWGHLLHVGLTSHDPTVGLPRVKPAAPRPRPTPEVVYRTALAGVTDHRVWLALRLAGETGMRRSEVAQVHARDVYEDLWGDETGWSIVAHGKGGKDRVLPLSVELARAVLAAAGGGWMLPGRIDGHLSGPYVGKLVAAALPGVWTMHTLRHRFGTLAADGGDLIAVQELLGHASVATTQRYVKRPGSALRRAAELAA